LTTFASKLAPTKSTAGALALGPSVKTAPRRNYWCVQPPA
jgi:hypothetical protein